MSPRPTKRIGELLVQHGLISEGQLAQALTEQRASKQFLGAILVQRGWIQPQALLEALSEQFGMRYESLAPGQVDWRMTAQFPPSVLKEGKCFPIRATEECVTVALANPLDAELLSAFEKVAKFRKIEPVLVLESELQAVCQAYRHRALQAIEERLAHHDGDPDTE